MDIKQVYAIVNDVAEQMYGNSDLQVVDLNGLVSLGNDVVSSASTKDKFLNILVDRIGKTIISQRAYSSQVADLMNDAFTFGAILQKIYVAPIQASTAEQWTLTGGQSVDQYVIAKPTVTQKLFSKRDVWEVDVTIPDYQLSTAFESAEQMAAFIDAIFLAIRNSQEVYLASMAELCYANMIGERIVHTQVDGGHTVINLLAEYNTTMGTSLSTSAAMHTTDFLKFASMTINLYVKRMSRMATIFNSEGYARFTPEDKLRVYMLADFTAATASYLQANTYHDELVALPKYKEVPYWQGFGKTLGFDNTSKIAIRTASGYSMVQPYVVAMLCDEEAIGLTYDNRRSRSAYNAKGEYTNFFEKADMGYFNDLSENAIVFTVGALVTPTESSVTPDRFTYSIASNADKALTLTLKNSETVSSIKEGSTTLTASTDYTIVSTTLTLLKAFLTAEAVGEHLLEVVLSSGATLPIYIEVTA